MSREKETPPCPENVPRRLDARHKALPRQLSRVGLVLRGSIGTVLLPCGNPKCRCAGNPPMLHGPYRIWTRKVAGKTVTVRLTNRQAAQCRRWSRNMRRFDRLAKRLQQIGLLAAEAMLVQEHR